MTADSNRLTGPHRDRFGCDHCDGSGPAPGHLYGDNGARGGPCPVCDPVTERELAWRNAEAQRDAQRRAGLGKPGR